MNAGAQPRIAIDIGLRTHDRSRGETDEGYLRGRLQEARWLIERLEARADTLLRVMRCLCGSSGVPGTRPAGDAAADVARNRRGSRPARIDDFARHHPQVRAHAARDLRVRAFFGSGIARGSGGDASGTAIQAMMRGLIEAENPRKPLSDAKLAGKPEDHRHSRRPPNGGKVP